MKIHLDEVRESEEEEEESKRDQSVEMIGTGGDDLMEIDNPNKTIERDSSVMDASNFVY